MRMYTTAKVLVVNLLLLGSCFCLSDEKLKTPRLDLVDIASELLARSETSSQVLSLNLTNLFILLVLKGLLFGATYLGTGYHKGRSLDNQQEEESILTESEILLLTSYLMSDANKDYSCLYRVACQEPKKSKEYLSAAKLLLKGSKLFTEKGYDKYDELVRDLQDAIEFGIKYGTCHQKYKCNTTNGEKV